jgi:hypothetical protein
VLLVGRAIIEVLYILLPFGEALRTQQVLQWSDSYFNDILCNALLKWPKRDKGRRFRGFDLNIMWLCEALQRARSSRNRVSDLPEKPAVPSYPACNAAHACIAALTQL